MNHLLVVEDSRTQAEALRADLEAAGFAVTVTGSGEEALEVLAAETFDLMLSDIVMPGMDGYALCAAVKENAGTKSLPVVLLTSLTDPLDVVRGLEAGADNFIRKPYEPRQLVSRLRTTLLNRELRSTGRMQMGIELSFLDRRFRITAERQQILDLLISTFEELIVTSREVRAREEDLAQAHEAVRQQLRRVELERSRLQAVLDAAPVPVLVVDAGGRVTHASRIATEVFETPLEQMCGRRPPELWDFTDQDGKPLAEAGRPMVTAARLGRPDAVGTAFDVLFSRRDGSRVPMVLQASPVLDERGEVAGAVGTAQVLGGLTLHDPTTGLPGHSTFAETVAKALRAPSRDVAVALIELDRFDVVSATLGREAADEVLAAAATRLRRLADALGVTRGAPDGVVAYLGNDQFGLLLDDVTEQLEILRVAESVRADMARPFEARGQVIRITASVGTSVGDSTYEAHQLLVTAGAALRRAREAGGNRAELLGRVASQEALDRLQLELDLRQAVEGERIELHYQAQVDLARDRVVGFEALARWTHERLGPVSPDVFIPLAEQSALILPLGRQVLTGACRQARAWQDAGLWGRDMQIAVNLSAAQLRSELVGEVVEILEQTRLDPSGLLLEITETGAMGDPETTVAVLDQLRGHGVRFALDDFGTGYSSLAYLNRIRFDQLKLDRSFVAGMANGGPDAAIAASVIALGHSLGVQVLAEGVEDQAQADALAGLGCDLAQGYLYSRPLPGQQLEQLMSGDSLDGSATSTRARRPSPPVT